MATPSPSVPTPGLPPHYEVRNQFMMLDSLKSKADDMLREASVATDPAVATAFTTIAGVYKTRLDALQASLYQSVSTLISPPAEK